MKAWAFLLVALLATQGVLAATLHGVIYDSDYNLIQDAVVEINTTPKQNHISKNGGYFFNVPLGSYLITVERFYQKNLVYSSEHIVEVTNDGQYQIDLITDLVDGANPPPLDDPPSPSLIARLRAQFGMWLLIVPGIVLALGVFLAVFLWMRRKDRGMTVAVEHEDHEDVEGSVTTLSMGEQEDLSHTLDGIVSFIKREGGRTTQKDIRKAFPVSEAKISLMISDLESQGRIKKIRKGRGNIIVLQ